MKGPKAKAQASCRKTLPDSSQALAHQSPAWTALGVVPAFKTSQENILVTASRGLLSVITLIKPGEEVYTNKSSVQKKRGWRRERAGRSDTVAV